MINYYGKYILGFLIFLGMTVDAYSGYDGNPAFPGLTSDNHSCTNVTGPFSGCPTCPQAPTGVSGSRSSLVGPKRGEKSKEQIEAENLQRAIWEARQAKLAQCVRVDPSGSAGNPIPPGFSGVKVESVMDVVVSLSQGQQFSVGRQYHSARMPSTALPDAPSMLGPSWYMGCETRLYVSGDFITWVAPDASFRHFRQRPGVSDTWETCYEQQGVFAEMTRESNGEYKVTLEDMNRYYFSGTGLPLRIVQQNGAAIQYIWDAQGRLAEMRTINGDPRYLTFEYNNTAFSDRVTSVVLRNSAPEYSTWSSIEAEYEYYGDEEPLCRGMLKSAGNPGKVKFVYRYGSYDPSSPTADEHGIVVSDYMKNNGLVRTLASISYRFLDNSEALVSAYAYRAGGMFATPEANNNGWSQAAVCKEYAAKPSPTNLMVLGQLNVNYTVVNPIEANDPDNPDNFNLDLARTYTMRVYKGDFWNNERSAYSSYTSDQTRYPIHITHHQDGKDLSHLSYFRAWAPETATQSSLVVFPGSAPMATNVGLNDADNHTSVVSVADAAGQVPEGAKYTFSEHLTELNGSLGQTTPFLSRMNKTFVTDEKGIWQEFGYGNPSTHPACNLPTSIKDSYGNTQTIAYNANGQPVTIWYSNGRVLQHTYNSFRQRATTVDNWGGTVTYTYTNNGAGLIASISESLTSQTISFSYNGAGKMTQISSNQGTTVTLEYDSFQRPLSLSADGITVLTATYNSAGEVGSMTDANGNGIVIEQDFLGQLTKVTDAAGGVTQFAYDSEGHMTEFRDAVNGVTKYAYDILGNLTGETRKGTSVSEDLNTIFEYFDGCPSCGASGGEPAKVTTPDGSSKVFSYDAKQRLNSVTFLNATGSVTREITFHYGITRQSAIRSVLPPGWSTSPASLELDWVSSITDSGLPFSNKTMSFEYDRDGRVIALTHPDGYREEFWYDVKGRMSARRDVDGGVFRYTYSTQGCLTNITDAFGAMTGYVYNSGQPGQTGVMGSLQGLNYANGTKVRYGYNNLLQLVSLSHINVADQAFETLNYTYDNVGSIKQISEAISGYGWKYTYDDVYRLIKEQRYNTNNNLPVWDRGYSYNAAGDRTGMTHFNGSTTTTASYSYNKFRQLTSFLDPALAPYLQSFTYDANGNRTAKAIQNSDSGTWNWDSDRRMVEVPGEAIYNFDHSGQRIYTMRNEGGPVPYRHFFNGLNEEIVKRGVTGSADAFAFEEKVGQMNMINCPPDGFLTGVFDSDLSRTVTQLTYSMGDDSRFEVYEGFPTTKKTASFWVKRSDYENDDVLVGFYVNTSDGERHVELNFSSGTDDLYVDGTEKYHKLWDATSKQMATRGSGFECNCCTRIGCFLYRDKRHVYLMCG